jgi:hypothetical protein
MKRVLFLLCGLCWIASGIVAGCVGCRILFDGGDSQTEILQIFAPDSASSILVGLIHTVGFCVLSGFCILVGIGLCSYCFEPRKDDDAAVSSRRSQSAAERCVNR